MPQWDAEQDEALETCDHSLRRVTARTCWGSMETTVIRFCPACGARVQAPESVFDGPCLCPTCHQRSQFYDYPRETPARPTKPSTRPTTTWFDRCLWSALVLVGLVAFIVLWALYEERADAAIVGSSVCLVLALAIVGFVVRVKRDQLRAVEAQTRAERALVVANSKLQAAGDIQRGFKKNFDALVTEEKRRLQNENAARKEQAELLYAEAQQRKESVETIAPKVQILGDRLLDEGVDRISRDLTASNLPASRRQMLDFIQFCRENGCPVSKERENDLLKQLVMDHETALLKAKHSGERQRIEAKMQEEERVIRELEQQIRSAEAERSAVQKKLNAVVQPAQDNDSEELEYLREKLALADQKAQEATHALAKTTAGYVYVLSNIGSLGPNVFKIGTTRRLDPLRHIEKLGAFLPFPYDIHMMIPSDDAAELEAALHEALHDCRINRLKHSKDFFHTDIQTIWRAVVAKHGTVDYVSEPVAEEYQESRRMSDEVFRRITDMHRSPESYRDPFEPKD